MKIIKNLSFGVLILAFIFTTKANAQEEKKEEFKPVFITVTKTHRNSNPDIDNSDWMKIEKEYFDKVTMKNDLIIGSGVYFHYFTPDDSEVLLVSVYKNWEDIENASAVTAKLIDEAWPNEEDRSNFFKKQSGHYEDQHSDEIYVSLPYTKKLETNSEKPLIYYVKKNQLGEGGSGFKEYFENVTQKNSYIKGYYSHRHRWGSNSKDAIEVFVFNSFEDIEKSFDEDSKLIDEYWLDEEKKKEFFKGYNKIFNGHGDYIYRNVPELAK